MGLKEQIQELSDKHKLELFEYLVREYLEWIEYCLLPKGARRVFAHYYPHPAKAEGYDTEGLTGGRK